MTADEDRFAAWAASEETEQDDDVPVDGAESGGSGFASREGRQFGAVVYWRRHLFSLSGRRAILQIKERPAYTATLTSKQGEVLFSAPVGELRYRRSWPFCFTIECDGARWRMWGIGVNSLKGAQRQLDVMKRDKVFTIIPQPPGMSDKRYKRLLTNKLAQQRLWRELWMVVLASAGGQQI
jgi:hypothetical protein